MSRKGFGTADFLPLIASQFLVTPAMGGGEVPLSLESVADTSTATRESFSLLFSGPEQLCLSHATHSVSHPTLGQFFLFLGPVQGGRPGHICYQALFSRLK